MPEEKTPLNERTTPQSVDSAKVTPSTAKEYSSNQKRRDFWLGLGGGFVIMIFFGGIWTLFMSIFRMAGGEIVLPILNLVALGLVIWLIVYLIRIRRYYFIIGAVASMIALPLLFFGACLLLIAGGGF